MQLPLIHKISYSWAGWPKSGSFPCDRGSPFNDQLADGWKRDGILQIAGTWSGQKLQVTVKSGPHLSASTVAARVKGRLDHQLRQGGWTNGFARKVALRSLGGNTIDQVLHYLATQLDRSDLVDSRYVRNLASVSWDDPDLDLSVPMATCRGRYWNDFHIVVVAQNRSRLATHERMLAIQSGAIDWSHRLEKDSASNEPCGLKSLSLMPDHVHLAVRLPVTASPETAIAALVTSLNKAAGNAFYSERVYIGSFSVYSLGSILGKT